MAEASVDLLFSNFLLPWVVRTPVFAEFRRVLAPRGFLSFTTLGPDTLSELRAAWAQVDSSSRVHPFIDMHDLGDALVRAGFTEPVLDVERYTLTYTDVRVWPRTLRRSGRAMPPPAGPKASPVRENLPPCKAPTRVHRRDGRLPATYEVVFGHAWAPAGPPRVAGEDRIALSEMQRQLQTRRRS